MKTIEEIRQENLIALIEEMGSIQKVASAIEKSHSQVSQWKNRSKDSKTGKPRNLDSDSARMIEAKCGKEVGWLDNPRTAELRSVESAPIRDRRAGASFGALMESFTDPETLKKEIMFCVDGMKPDNKIALLSIANHLYNNDNPGKHRGKPFTEQAPNKAKKSGTLKVGLANPEPGAVRSAAQQSSADRRVSKQRNR